MHWLKSIFYKFYNMLYICILQNIQLKKIMSYLAIIIKDNLQIFSDFQNYFQSIVFYRYKVNRFMMLG